MRRAGDEAKEVTGTRPRVFIPRKMKILNRGLTSVDFHFDRNILTAVKNWTVKAGRLVREILQ